MSGVQNFPQTLPANTVIANLEEAPDEVKITTFYELAAALAPIATANAADVPAKGTTYSTSGVQYYPQTIPASTVVGRAATASGPSTAIPFCQFGVALYPYLIAAIVGATP